MRINKFKYNQKYKFLFIGLILFLSIFMIGLGTNSNKKSMELLKKSKNSITSNRDDIIYLSDLDFITDNNWSYNGWAGHEIRKDKNQDGGTLSLLIDNERRYFTKGVSIHGKGQATYDISKFSTEFSRFIAKIGVDAARGNNGLIWIQILVSNNGKDWISLLKTDNMNGNTNAVDVDVNIAGYKYLRIYIDPVGSNAADHGTIANARLVKSNFDKDSLAYERIKTNQYYDEILNKNDVSYNYKNNYRQVLEREFVRKIGYWNIQELAEHTNGMVQTLEWILSKNEILEQIIEVGEISNSITFMNVLNDLYIKNKQDLNTANGYVYQKMMIALAAAYSTDRIISPLAFSFQSPTYDYVERFNIMKQFFDNNQLRKVKTNALQGEFVKNDWFKDYHVELMRMVMQDGTNNGDLIWLNGFTNEKQSISFYMIGYVSPTYTQDRFYNEVNKETYDQRFYLTKYGVPYGLTNGVKVPRYWMVFANGGICWNASRVGQSMYRVNGIPATGAYQVGHELYIQYYEDENGNGYWTPRYGNWSGAGSTWGGGNPYRYIFNWNNKSFTDKHISGSKVASSTGYLYLGQDNLNHYEEYKKSLYYNLTANSYANNNQKLDSYFKALEVNKLNLDSYDNIINLYKQMSNKNEGGTITSHDWYNLSLKIIDAYKYHPVPMFDLIKVIRPYLEGSERLYIDRLEKETLEKATTVTADKTLQVDGVRTHARQLLNKTQPDPMIFSFDGENAGKIVKNPMYQLAWGYSLDGGKTFTDFKIDDEITLTSEEINKITVENDIIINFMGLSYTFRIDITKGTMSNNLFANDLENRVVGIDLTYEWRNNENNPWTSYKDASPDNTGDKTLYVRRKAIGTQLASDSVTYTFTEDNQPNTRKYVPVSHLSIHDVSTEATSNQGSAIYAIDGNYNTRWHSAWNGTDTERFITIKLDKPRYVSAVEFVPAGGGNGRIYDGTIWGSYDGENWEKLSEMKNLTYPQQANTNEQAILYTKNFEISDSKEVQYIKVVADRTNGNWFTARAFNIYQDLTKSPRPTAGIGYSETEPTTKNVIARLVNPSTNITITNNNGSDTYTFTENGKFTFEFEDEKGTKGTSTAKVDWIDREKPTATIEYSTTSFTNQTVVATLKPSEDVIVTNNGEYKVDEDRNIIDKNGNIIDGYTVDDDGNVKDSNGNFITNINTFTYEFLSNGEFTFEFMDKAGNKGSAIAKVTWIDYDIPNATLSYNIQNKTNKNVTVTAEFDEDVIVTNNGGNHSYTFDKNGEFTFEFKDRAGNKNSITAKVNWIDKVAPTAQLKYEKIGNKIIVKVINPSKNITFKNGNGIYEFNKNGSYDIYFFDEVGNMGRVTAIIKGLKEDLHDNSNAGNNSSKENNEGNNKSGNRVTNNNRKQKSETNTNINNGNPTSQNTITTKNNEDSSDKLIDSDKEKKEINEDSKLNMKEVESEKNKKSTSKGIYILLVAIVAILGVTVIGIFTAHRRK